MRELTKEMLEKIEKNPSCINFKIQSYYRLSEEFIEKYFTYLDWRYISTYQKLSEELIEKYSDRVDWQWISCYQKLSEEFIEKHSDKVEWRYISKHQKLSHRFMIKFASKIHWTQLLNYNDESYTDDIVNNPELMMCIINFVKTLPINL